MRRILARWGAALALLAFGTAASAEEVLEPTSAWTLDYGEEKCSLLRDFGSLDDDGMGLRIDSYGSLISFRVNLIGDRIPRSRNPFSFIDLDLSSEEEPRTRIPALHGTVGDYRFIDFALTVLPEDAVPPPLPSGRNFDDARIAELALSRAPQPAFEQTIDGIAVALRQGKYVKLNTGPMAPALEALRTCVDDLRSSWGLDPAQQRAITRTPYPPAEAVKNVMENYPRDQMWQGINGFVPIRIMVDETGRATECIVQLESAPEAFREAACDRIGDRFHPALDANGEPVAGFYQNAVVYLTGRL